MTEQEKPPLLSDEQMMAEIWDLGFGLEGMEGRAPTQKERFDRIAQTQREADIKWMKENCYLIAGGKLPDIISFLEKTMGGLAVLSLNYEADLRKKFSTFMLKEVNGISFKAVRGWD